MCMTGAKNDMKSMYYHHQKGSCPLVVINVIFLKMA